MAYFYPPFFSIVSKRKIALHSSRVIHELWEEVMNCNQLITFDLDVPPEVFEPWDDWENELEELPQVCALFFSLFWMNVLSPWSSIVPNLTNFLLF